MPGTGCCSLIDTVKLTQHAVEQGAAGVLMLPPFYYKGVSDDGLFRYFSDVIDRVGDSRLRVYLYHIPPVAQVPISLALVERLLTRYPGTVVGIKDSSADWQNSKALLDAFPGFDVFVGTENSLLQNMRHGGAGCISATANVNPARIHNLYANWQSRDADQLQTELDKVRAAHARYPMIAALKATISIFSGQDEWRQVRPPLVALNEALAQALEADLRGLFACRNCPWMRPGRACLHNTRGASRPFPKSGRAVGRQEPSCLSLEWFACRICGVEVQDRATTPQ